MKFFYKKLSTLVVLLFLSNINTIAGHNEIGSHIGYKYIDSSKYEVIVTIYRDCNSISPNTVQLGITNSIDGYSEKTLKKVSTTDITGAYLKCNFISRCTGSYAYGFEKVVYKDTVDVSTGSCEYRFSFKECCRNSNITTGAANTNYYNYAIVNKCIKNNSSVQADLNPRLIVPVGQDVFMTTFTGDKTDKQDSVVYSLVDIYEDSVTKVKYSGHWSAQRPLSFLGFPNTGLNSPAGFEFNEKTSDLRFRPTVQNQTSIICVEAKEYRRINGLMTAIGLTRMEYEIIVASNINKTPTLKGNSAVACVGQKTCIDFETDDPDKNDSTFLEFIGLPQGATVTYARKGRLATAQICYIPKQADAGNIPYQFTAFVTDNSCTVEGRSSSSFTYTVSEAPNATTLEVKSKTTSCSSADIIVGLKNTGTLKGLSWEIFDEDNISKSTNDTAKLFFKGSGWKKFFVVLKATNSLCTFTLEDSVFITPQYSLNLATKNDSSFCSGQTATLFTNPLNGSAPFLYNWTKENSNFTSTSKQFSQNINVAGENRYFVFVSDNNGCIGADSTKITLFTPLTIDAGNYPSFCSGAGSVQLKASINTGTAPYNYTWLPTNATTDTTTVAPTSTTSYILKVEDDNGCISYDTAKVIVAPAISFSPPATTATCQGKNVTLQVSSVVGVAPITFTWDGKLATDKYTFINPQQSKAVVIEMIDSNNCKTSRFVQVVVNDNPEVILVAKKTVCIGASELVKASAQKGKPPYTYKWSNNISTASFTAIITTPKQFIVEVTDSNGCKASDNIQYQLHPKDNITINQLPVQCAGGNPVALKANPNLGAWSGNGVSGGNLFIPQLAGVGVHKLEYNYTSTKNCAEKDEMYVVVKKLPVPNFTVDKTKGAPNTQFNFTNQSTADTTYTIAWDFGDFGAPGNISLLADPNYMYTKKGLYTVKLTIYNGVCDPQTETKVDYILVDSATVSIPEISKVNIKLYPNPAKDKLTIEADNPILEIVLVDVLGKRYKIENFNPSTKAEINVAHLAAGIYIIEAKDVEGNSYVSKLQISK